MSEKAPGAGQGALPPREGQAGLRTVPDRPPASGTTMRLTQVVGGQYVITSQPHGMPSLTQISPSSLSGTTGVMGTHTGQPGVTRIISISPSRGQSTSPLRPSVANQSIVNVLTSKSRPSSNVRLQLFPSSGDGQIGSATGTSLSSRPLKRPPSFSGEKKDSYASKLQRVMNHRIVRSKLVKEKYNEHLLEAYYLEMGSNILDLYQFAKKPKTQAYLAYLRDHAIDPKDYQQQELLMETSSTVGVAVPITTPSTPSATAASSLPGISHSTSSYTSTSTVSTISPVSTDSIKASMVAKAKSQLNTTPSGSPTSGGTTPTSTAATNQELIVEKAKQEAYVVQRISDLQKEGLWSERRLPKIQEMPRNKAHWDFLLEEMHWLAADFAQERKWKKAAAKKCARMVQKYFQDKALAAQRAEKAQEQHLRRMAAFCAREIKIFWSNVEKLVEYKQNTILEEKRKKALDQQLSFIVDQTEKYSQLLAEGMNKQSTVQSSDQQKDQTASNMSSRCPSRVPSDVEFEPDEHSEEEDDEETIAQEEAMVDKEGRDAEVEALQKESQMELDDLLEDDLLRNYLMNRDSIRLSESEDEDDKRSGSKSKEDDEKDESDSSREEEEDEASEDENEEKEAGEETQTSQEGEDELKMLLAEDSHNEGEITKTDKKDDLINDAAAIAESIQPKGNTLSSTNVSTNIPFLLKYSLREYQHIGLDWLVTMYERKLNGILADEMGLGKTIQTIALLAHLACEKENWGPHLIVVPTSVMLNWEMECKKWCPAFKILTYYGSQKERKLKRTGWTKPNAFHICITSYKLVIQDHQSFRRKKWKYLILDEAQNIKNFKSQRWQLLLNFQTQQRLLLTGTPLQNNLMELWSLMHFLMPNVFQSHREFKEWFSNPVTGMIEGNSEYNENIIKRLHKVLRPFLLRRLKSEVEKQMPKKYEHVVMCRLSKRQRFLYDDYMSRAKTKETLATGNLLSVINVLMQLRKVCNHPNLFEVRPTISPFQCEEIKYHIPSIVYSALDYDPWKHVDLYALNLLLIMHELRLSSYQCYRLRQSRSVSRKIVELGDFPADAAPESDRPPPCPPNRLSMRVRAAAEVKLEKRDAPTAGGGQHQQGKGGGATPGQHQKVKLSNVQLINQPGFVKAIPVVNISQAGQVSGQGNNATVLKPTTNFAQIVQSATGKHLVLTSNPGITTNIPITYTTSVQTLKFLSKQPMTTVGNAGHGVTKAFVKFQLSSVTTVNTTPITTTNSVQCPVKSEEKNSLGGVRPSVGNDYIGRLYSKQNNLDVRWKDKRSNRSKDTAKEAAKDVTGDKEDPKGECTRRLQLMATVNARRCDALPLYGRDFQDVVKIFKPNKMDIWSGGYVRCLNTMYDMHTEEQTDCLKDVLYNPERRIEQLKDVCDRFIFFVPAVKAPEPEMRVWHPSPSKYWGQQEQKQLIRTLFSKMATPLHPIASAMVTQFPDPRLIQYDCGKLQTLDRLLRRLKAETHRVLIFTQMTKMLDVLEAFLNYHGHIYLRLDGTTKVDQRQALMERFNNDKRIFAFILSTRSGGVGVNLTGADTVIFYDSDWNPTMDAQAQDRCHRIGQTRDVHIYRLVSERTIEENILKKANQKRLLGDLAIEGGNFTTAYFKSSTIQDLFDVDQSEETTATSRLAELVDSKKEEKEKSSQTPVVATTSSTADEKTAVGALESALAACEDDQDVQAARTAKAEAVADLAEFDEDIPLEEQQQEPAQQQQKEVSKAEQEINSVIEKLSPIEKYAMKFIEATESAWSAEQLAAAEREIEEQKREWEKNRLAAMREEEERRARELEEEADIITYSREDAANQVSNIQKFRRFKFKARRKIVKVNTVNKKLLNKVKMKRRRKRRRLKQIETDDAPPPQLNGDTENSLDSTESLSSSGIMNNRNSNHVDHNSPRTRSRGTVAINLWTLDVSPILPGEKPMKRNIKERATSLSEDCQSGSEEKTVRKKSSKRRASSVSGDDSQSGGEEKVVVVKRKRGRPRNEDKGKLIDSGICEVKKCTVILNDILADGQVHISSEHEAKNDDKSITRSDTVVEDSEKVGKSDPSNETNMDCDVDASFNSREKTNSDCNSAEATGMDEHHEKPGDSINIEEPIQIQNETQLDEIAEKVAGNLYDSKQSPPHNENENMDTKSEDVDQTVEDSVHTVDPTNVENHSEIDGGKSEHVDETVEDSAHTVDPTNVENHSEVDGATSEPVDETIEDSTHSVDPTNVENHSGVDQAKEPILATDTNETDCDSTETHDLIEQQRNHQSDDEKVITTDGQTSTCQENETSFANDDILAELDSEIDKIESSSKIIPNNEENVVDDEAAAVNSDEAAKETTETALDGNTEIDNSYGAVSVSPKDTDSNPIEGVSENSVIENSENFTELASHNHESEVEGLVNNKSTSQICNSTHNTEETLENAEIDMNIPVNNDITNANEANESESGTLFLKHPKSNLKFRPTGRKPYRKLGNNNGKTLDGWIKKSPKDTSVDEDTSNAN